MRQENPLVSRGVFQVLRVIRTQHAEIPCGNYIKTARL